MSLVHDTVKSVLYAATLILIYLLLASPAFAAGSGMPWEGPIQQIVTSVEGDVAKGIGVIAIVVTGLGIAFGDMGSGMRNLLKIVFGLSIAFTATSFFLSFFSFGGGAII
ncbi:MAG: TrbC/VirB2 family protein [Pseudomonadota bacterium]